MPDVNLLKDTERFQEASKKPEAPKSFDLSTPDAEEKKGLGGVFRSLFNRKPPAPPPPPTSATGTMSVGRTRPGERILSETKKAAPSVIPLPDEESFNVNLLTEELVGKFNPQQKLLQLGLVAVGAAVFVGLVYGGLSFYEKSVTSQVKTAEDSLRGVNREIGSLRDKQLEIVDTTKKIAAIKSLIDRHIRWTKFFDRLEHYTLPNVSYGTIFTGDVSGALTFTATTDSFENVAAEYLILEQAVKNGDFIDSFEISGANHVVSNNISTVTFHESIQLKPELLENTTTLGSSTASTTETNTNVSVDTNTNIPLP